MDHAQLTLISATPSPFARINRIALHEKKIPFTLRNEIPWEDTTETPKYNPLEKLPILLFADGRDPVYDSSHIQEYIVQKYASVEPRLLTGDVDLDLKVRQIQVLGQGLMDAFVLCMFEKRRGEGLISEVWLKRQQRKIDGAMRAMEDLAKKRRPEGSEFLVGGVLTIADIAVVCAVGQIEFVGLRPQWRTDLPVLSKYVEKLEERESFRRTRPEMFDLKQKVL